MEEESFTQSLFDTPDDLAADGTLTVMRTEDFGAWYRRVRDAHEREVDGGVDSMTDAELAEHGLVRLPTDADGVPIRVDDVMEWPTTGETFEVVGIGDGTLFYIEDGNELADWTGASTKRHHHEPTVEDVLREFTDEVWNRCCEGATASDSGIDELVAEFAAKLRLAGEDA